MKNKTHRTAYTCEEMMLDMLAAIKEMTPREKAQIRVELRKDFGMPAQPEPDLWMNWGDRRGERCEIKHTSRRCGLCFYEHLDDRRHRAKWWTWARSVRRKPRTGKG